MPGFRLLAATTLCFATHLCPAMTLIHNANIHTVNEGQPRATAMVFDAGGRIQAVGTDALLERYPDARRVDLEGRTVVPGFIDAHAHIMSFGIGRLRVDLTGTRSRDEVLARLTEFESTLQEDEWLLGRGWDQNDWPVHEFPTASDLDAVFPSRPVWLERIDGHAAWANTAAMEQARVDLNTAVDPQGGRIVRDRQGRPTGILVDAATDFIQAAVPAISEAQRERALRITIAEANRVGLTGVHDAWTSLADFRRYQRALTDGALTLRVYAMADGDNQALERLCREGPLEVDGRLSLRSVKFYLDGALGSRGAALLAEYSDDPGNRGLLRYSPETLTRLATAAMGCGLQVNTHAIGDAANRIVLDAYAQAIRTTGGGPGRHRVEHAQTVSPQDMPRFGRMGVVPSMQPTHATSDMYWAEERLGPERIRGAYAWQALKDTGARLVFGSDFPVEDMNPLLGFYAAVSRQDLKGWPEGGWYPEQRLDRAAALRAFTLDAAWAAFREHDLGSLEAGKRADFVVLSADIMDVPLARIPETRVLATWLDGRPVYEAP